MPPTTYQQAHHQSNQEASFCLVGALFVTIFFWGAIFFTKDSLTVFFGIPIWFWLSCIGGYILSVAVVWILIGFKMKNFDFDDAIASLPEEKR